MYRTTSANHFLRLCLRRAGLILLLLACIALAVDALSLSGQEKRAEPRDGMFISVPATITKPAFEQIEAKIANAVARKKRPIRTIVFDFNPGGYPSTTRDFEDCLRLTKYIDRLNKNRAKPARDVQTIAFVRGKVSQHAVLPVLACSQIIMSGSGSLGPVRAEGEEVRSYRKTAESKGIWDIVERMLNNQEIDAVEARKVNLCKETYEDRDSLRKALGLPPKSLREDWLAGKSIIACKVELNGAASRSNLESLKRRLKSVVQRGHNFIILWLNSEGGDETYLAGLIRQDMVDRENRTDNPVKIIAYVPPKRNLGAATILALGASEIVMGRDSSLGDFAYLKRPEMAATLAAYAKQRGCPPALFQATLDPNVVIYRVYARSNGAITGYVSEEEWKRDQESATPYWSADKVRVVKNNEGLVKITANMANEAAIASYTDVNSFADLCKKYNIEEPGNVTISRGDWLDRVAEFFREPLVKILLLLIGITGLILEIKMPGFGIPGIIAAVCFLLFFWAHSFVNQYTTLAILLFLLGLILLGIEVFVLPGFGVCGFAGIALVIVSLLLVTLEKMPESSEDWTSLGWTFGSYILSLIGAIAAAIAIASFLPQIPYANRLMLQPPEEAPDADHLDLSAAATEANAALLGAIGITETPLRPAGKARFGNDYLDVVSQGDYIMPGSRVQVIEIEGNRIVVKQV